MDKFKGMVTLSFDIEQSRIPEISEILSRMGISKITLSQEDSLEDEEKIIALVSERRVDYINNKDEVRDFHNTIDEIRKEIHDL